MADTSFRPGLDAGSGGVLAGGTAVWDALPDALVLARANGTVVVANTAAADLLGWPAKELVGQPLDVVVPERFRPAVEAAGRGWVEAAVRPRGSGPEVPVALHVSSSGDGVVVVLRDLRAERAAAHDRRLASLADLAGTMAHELNNVLAVVLSSAGFLADVVGDDPVASADVERLRAAAERAARLTRRLVGVGAAGEASPRAEPVDLRAVVDDLVPLVERIGVDLRVGRGLPVVHADRRDVEQLVLSLVLDDGEGERVVTVSPAGAGSFAVRGRMSTLALTSAYAIVRRNGGSLAVSDDDSVVTVSLPVEAAAVVVDLADERRQVVVVVDDQAALRMLTARLLRKDGFTVLEAASAADALRLVDGNVVDLVVSDVVMPGMSGVELCEALLSQPDGPAVVLMSGYSEAMVSGPQGTAAGVPLLRKPFSEEQLLEVVRRSGAERRAREGAGR